jgi:hypothetical protein
VKFIVEPQKEEKQYGRGQGGPGGPCNLFITMCALCSENPRFCPDTNPDPISL